MGTCVHIVNFHMAYNCVYAVIAIPLNSNGSKLC